MKTNAIIRIIIWSLVLVILIGLLGGLFLFRYERAYRTEPVFRSDPPAETMVPVRIDTPEDDIHLEATVNATAVNVRSAPNSDSEAVGMLSKNETVYITRQESVNDQAWAFITHPCAGWVRAEFLTVEEIDPPVIAEQNISLDPRQIREIDIEWVAGTITIEPANVDTIQVTESNPKESKYTMVWKQTNDKLVVCFSESNHLNFNFGVTINDVVSKDLTVLVPMGWECDSLEVAAASAALKVNNMAIREVDFDGASGVCEFENCVIEELDLDTASGDIFFTGSLEKLDCDAASASVTAVFDNVPKVIDMDSMSGDLDVTLPSSAGFTVSLDALSSDFVCDFGYSQKNDTYYRGNGECMITMDAMSGDLYIREYKEAAAAPEVPAATEIHHHTDACTTNPDSCPDNAAHHTEPHHS